MSLDKRYTHQEVEAGKYEFWKTHRYFEAGRDKQKPPFSMVIPPPNVTGRLHLGHAWDSTIQDIIARYKLSKGFDVLWLPGSDHAGIATQAKVDARLKAQGTDRYQLGREKFLQAAWSWKEEYATAIRAQWAKLGIAIDYSRERFTLDDGLNKAVNHVFVTLYNQGLIYRGERIINWDPVMKTALSNIEVIYKEDPGKFYYFKYPIVGSDEYLSVATTRPETMFGDVCVVVNPSDPRYLHLHNARVINPANHEIIPIITDEYVDVEFGTGAMKCTPAHDPNDFKIGEKYGLERPVCLNLDATMNELAGDFNGLDRFECRDKLVARIEREGNLLKIDNIIHQVGHSERSDAVVEPFLSKQWFISMRPLADLALENQNSDQAIEFLPDRFTKTFQQWMEKTEDWCISRQLWWGHRIPAYYHKQTGEVYVGLEPPTDRDNYLQDEDVLDTWFSSALWPFSTLGWPEETEDFLRYYPTDVLSTGYDIIFFWVARMVFQGLHFTHQRPFKTVLLHGLIRDEKGRKMSKSLGNGVDPMDIIDRHGADALRYFLATNSTPGQDMRYIEEKVESSANYLNKIWNAARYILMNLPADFTPTKLEKGHLNPIDRWILAKAQQTISNFEGYMDRYEFGIASTYLYNFVYDDFCSSYLELSKVALQSDDKQAIAITHQVLYTVLKAILLMITPFSPFITEEIYLQLPGHQQSIMEETYPSISIDLTGDVALEEVDILLNMIKDLRAYRADNGLAPNQPLTLTLTDLTFDFTPYRPFLTRFGFAQSITEATDGNHQLTSYFYGKVTLYVEHQIDVEELKAKLDKEIAELEAEVARGTKMLGNPNFINKAPADKVETEKKKLADYQSALEQRQAKRAALK